MINKIYLNSELYHYGIPRRSGRYPYGSGEKPRAIYRSTKKELKRKYKDTNKRNDEKFQAELKNKKYPKKDIEAEYAVRAFINKKEYRKALSKKIKNYKGSESIRYKINKKILNTPYKDVQLRVKGPLRQDYRVKDKGKNRYDVSRITRYTTYNGPYGTQTSTFYTPIKNDYKPRKRR